MREPDISLNFLKVQVPSRTEILKAPCRKHGLFLKRSLIHSFIQVISINSAPSSSLLLRGARDYNIDTVLELTCRRQLRVKDLPMVPNMVVRVGFEPATIRMQGTEPTTEPPANHAPQYQYLSI